MGDFARIGGVAVEFTGDTAGLSAAGSKVESILGRLGERAGGLTERMNLGRMMGGVLRGAGVLFGVQAAFQAVNAVIAAGKGDWEAVDEAMGRLPAGFGAVYQAAHGLIGQLSGITDEIARLKHETAEFVQYASGVEAAAKAEVAWERRTRLARAAPEVREVAGIQEQAGAAREGALERARKAGIGEKHAAVKAEIAAIARWETAGIEEVERRRSEAERKRGEAHQARQMEFQVELYWLDRQAGAMTEVERRVVEIERRYDDMIVKMREAGVGEEEIRRAHGHREREKAAAVEEVAKSRGGGAAALAERFERDAASARERTMREGPAKQYARIEREHADRVAEINRALEEAEAKGVDTLAVYAAAADALRAAEEERESRIADIKAPEAPLEEAVGRVGFVGVEDMWHRIVGATGDVQRQQLERQKQMADYLQQVKEHTAIMAGRGPPVAVAAP